MLSVFPNLFDYALFAPLLLRLGMGALFIIRGSNLARQKDKNGTWREFWKSRIAEGKIEKVITAHGIIQCIIGAAFVFGFLTQIAAIFAIVLTLIEWQHDTENNLNEDITGKFSHVFPILISVALLLLGAGFLAVDLPL